MTSLQKNWWDVPELTHPVLKELPPKTWINALLRRRARIDEENRLKVLDHFYEGTDNIDRVDYKSNPFLLYLKKKLS